MTAGQLIKKDRYNKRVIAIMRNILTCIASFLLKTPSNRAVIPKQNNMKLETYLKYRAIFDIRYGERLTMCGDSVLKPMMKGIRHRYLFFMIYCYDRQISHISQGVSSIDKDTRYYTYRSQSCTRVRRPSRKISMIDRYNGYNKLLEYCIGVLKVKGIKA